MVALVSVLLLQLEPVKLRPTSFSCAGELSIIQHDSMAAAVSAGSSQKLVFTGSAKTLTISSLSDLTGLVTIDSPLAALEFVRLDTSPFTFDLFGSRTVQCEVLTPASLASASFGLDKAGALSVRISAGVSGVVSERTMAELGIESPRVERIRDSYVIKRALVRQCRDQSGRESSHTVVEVEEVVWFNGHLERTVTKEMFPAPRAWFFLSLADYWR